jgi:hypothetical protein
MNDDTRFDRTARSWLEEGPTRAPGRAVEAALAEITTTPQERDLRVPWRFSTMPMLIRAAAAAIAIAVIGGGALFLLRAPTVPGVAAQATPSPSPSPMALADFVAARNAICDQAVTDTDALKARFVGVFDGSITAAQRADWIAALEAFRARYDPMIRDLAALEPPTVLATDDEQILQDLRSQSGKIQTVIDALREHRDADAQAADSAADPFGTRVERWESEHVLHHCP